MTEAEKKFCTKSWFSLYRHGDNPKPLIMKRPNLASHWGPLQDIGPAGGRPKLEVSLEISPRVT